MRAKEPHIVKNAEFTKFFLLGSFVEKAVFKAVKASLFAESKKQIRV